MTTSRSVDNSPILHGSNGCTHPTGFGRALRRAGSLNAVSRTVRTPVELISLERARAMTVQLNGEGESPAETGNGVEGTKKGKLGTLDELEVSLMALSIEHSIRMAPPAGKIEISAPIHLQESLQSSSYPGPGNTTQIYSPCADHSPPLTNLPKFVRLSCVEEEEEERNSIAISPGEAIQKYIDKVSQPTENWSCAHCVASLWLVAAYSPLCAFFSTNMSCILRSKVPWRMPLVA